jgi:glycine cleavage system H lipoate-binding protein
LDNTKIVELNERVLEFPALFTEKPESEGFLAILMLDNPRDDDGKPKGTVEEEFLKNANKFGPELNKI